MIQSTTQRHLGHLKSYKNAESVKRYRRRVVKEYKKGLRTAADRNNLAMFFAAHMANRAHENEAVKEMHDQGYFVMRDVLGPEVVLELRRDALEIAAPRAVDFVSIDNASAGQVSYCAYPGTEMGQVLGPERSMDVPFFNLMLCEFIRVVFPEQKYCCFNLLKTSTKVTECQWKDCVFHTDHNNETITRRIAHIKSPTKLPFFLFVPLEDTTYLDFRKVLGNIGRPREVSMKVRAGDVLMMSYKTTHKTGKPEFMQEQGTGRFLPKRSLRIQVAVAPTFDTLAGEDVTFHDKPEKLEKIPT